MMTSARNPAFLAVLILLLSLSGSAIAIDGPVASGSGGWRIGYSSRLIFDVTREDARLALDLWTRELGRDGRIAGTPKATIYDDLPSLVAAIRSEEVDFIALTTLDYMKLQNQLGLEPAVFGTKGGRIADEQILLVRADSGFDRLGKLRNRRLMIMTGGREIASLWLDIQLAKQGLAPFDQFFAATKEAGKASQVILPVFFRQADACVVNRNAYATAVELNPQIGRAMMVLAKTPPVPLAVTCFRPTLPREQKEKLLSAYEKLLTTPAGRQILTLFRIDGTQQARPGDLDTIEALLREHGNLKGMAKRN
jgi:phosphonate transport system substrate-binding protein